MPDSLSEPGTPERKPVYTPPVLNETKQNVDAYVKALAQADELIHDVGRDLRALDMDGHTVTAPDHHRINVELKRVMATASQTQRALNAVLFEGG